MAEATKRCPFCGEEILAVARKCKHCHSDLPENDRSVQSAVKPAEESHVSGRRIAKATTAIVVLFIVGFAVAVHFPDAFDSPYKSSSKAAWAPFIGHHAAIDRIVAGCESEKGATALMNAAAAKDKIGYFHAAARYGCQVLNKGEMVLVISTHAFEGTARVRESNGDAVWLDIWALGAPPRR